MTVYPKATMSKEEFGEILAEYIQKSRAIEVEHTINIHLIDENGTEISTIDTDDMYGLVLAIGAVIRRFEPGILQQYEGLDEYGLDIYDKRDGKKLLQIDRNIHKEGVEDVRFNIEVFKEFGFPVPALDMARNYMVHFYD
jgi:hypothetical protein